MPDQPLERFRPTIGRWIGVAGIVMLVVVGASVASTGFDKATVLVVLVCALLAVLTWASLVRPTVHARRQHLMVRNAWTQKRIPWHAVTSVDVRQTLQVETGEELHHAIAVGKSARQILRGGRASGGDPLASRASREFASQPTLEGSEVVGTDYADYVATKIETYASLHRAESSGDVERTVTWPLVVAAITLLLAVVVAAVVL